jgi:hypothetical protein
MTFVVISGNAEVSGQTVMLTGTGKVRLRVIQAAAGAYTAASANTAFTVEAPAGIGPPARRR